MSMVINTNQSALNALNKLEKTKFKIDTSMEKLSSGLKINRGADDAANLAIATRMSAQIGSLMQAAANAQAGVSLINIADSSLGTISDSLVELRALAIQAANGTLTTIDRNSISQKAISVLDQIDSITNQTSFNGVKLLDGTFNTILQVGTETGDIIDIKIASSNIDNIGSVITNGTPIQGPLGAGQLVINGENIAPSQPDGLSFDQADASAIAIANAINTSGTDANVTASANPTITETVNFIASNNAGGMMTINGHNTTPITITNQLADNVEAAIIAINNIKTQTGVEASADAAGKLVLTAADGRNITVAYGAGIQNTDLGAVTASTTISSISLTSNAPITIGGSNPQQVGLTSGTNSVLIALSTATLDTQANAVASLSVIDGAIDTISAIRSSIGAIESRLYIAIENLSDTSVNLQDAKSQIMDTDFAAEMTNFAKQQILQQAGISMLAQANSNPESILKLLQ